MNYTEQVDPWHFPRTELAERYLTQFKANLNRARALFARRRMGKTEFLRQDLMPIAAREGYTCVYCNLWEWQENPLEGLHAEIQGAISDGQNALQRFIKRGPVVKGIKVNILGTGLDTAVGADSAVPMLQSLWDMLDIHPKPILLLIDEAQVLAGAQHVTTAGALRAGLDIRKDKIKVLFTGSSEQTLRTMFGSAKQPFYNWAPIEPFPLLDNLFVTHLTDVMNGIVAQRYQMQDQEAQNAFQELNSSPEVFRRCLDEYLTRPFDGMKAAVQRAREKTFNDAGFQDLWKQQLPMDQLLLRHIAAGKGMLTSKAVREEFGETLGLGTAAPLHAVNNALKRLCTNQLLVPTGRGVYQFEDAEFRDWLRLEQPIIE